MHTHTHTSCPPPAPRGRHPPTPPPHHNRGPLKTGSSPQKRPPLSSAICLSLSPWCASFPSSPPPPAPLPNAPPFPAPLPNAPPQRTLLGLRLNAGALAPPSLARTRWNLLSSCRVSSCSRTSCSRLDESLARAGGGGPGGGYGAGRRVGQAGWAQLKKGLLCEPH